MAHFFDYGENGPGQLALTTDAGWITGIDLNDDASYDGNAPTIPSTATGIILRHINVAASQDIGARAYGSSKNRVGECYLSTASTMIFVKCDANQKIDIYQESQYNSEFYVLGYFDDSDGSEFFADGSQYEFNPSSASTWYEHDLSSHGLDTDATFAIIEIEATSYNYGVNFCNPNGDEDADNPSYSSDHTWVIVPAYNGYIRLFAESTSVNLYLIGQIIGETAFTAGSDVSLSTTGSYATVDMSSLSPPANAVMAVVEIRSSSLFVSWGMMRYDDSANYPDIYKDLIDTGVFTLFPLLDIDDSKNDRCLAKIESANIDFFVWGWITNTSGTTYYQSCAGDMPAQSGALTDREIYGQSIAGDMPAAQADVIKKIMLQLAGNTPAASGGISKSIGKNVAGDMPAPSGDAVKKTSISVSGDMPASSGSLSAALVGLAQSIFGDMPAPAGAIIKKIGKFLSGEMPASSGGLSKKTEKALSGDSPAASGDLSSAWNTSESTAGDMPAPSGVLSSILNPVSSAVKLLKIVGASFKKLIGG